MRNNHIILGLTLFLGLFLLPTSSFADHKEGEMVNSQKVLNIGIFPRRNISVTRKIFEPLRAYLETKLKRSVKLQTPKTFSSFWDNVENKKYDLVHFNQYHYIISQKKFGYRVILRNKEFGEDTISGAIIVRKDSGINSVDDLRYKRIVFGGSRKAMQSYIIARHLLEDEGLTLNQYRKDFALNPPNAIMAVYYKKASAAGVGDKILQLEMVKNQINTGELKVLKRGEQLPQLPWAINHRLSHLTQTKIQTILSTMHQTSEGKAILKAAKLDQFVKTIDSDYNEHRIIIQDVLGESY